jgi:hypothetical protein
MSFEILNQTPEERLQVVISRHWDRPQIEVTVNREKIAVVMDMQDFIKALAAEMPPTWKTLTKDRRDSALSAAYLKTIEKVKEATSAVM